jgi:hypothetical protein
LGWGVALAATASLAATRPSTRQAHQTTAARPDLKPTRTQAVCLLAMQRPCGWCRAVASAPTSETAAAAAAAAATAGTFDPAAAAQARTDATVASQTRPCGLACRWRPQTPSRHKLKLRPHEAVRNVAAHRRTTQRGNPGVAYRQCAASASQKGKAKVGPAPRHAEQAAALIHAAQRCR